MPLSSAPLTSVSMPSPMASTSRATNLAAEYPTRRLQRRLVDRLMRLAGNKRAAAEQRIVAGQRAGAPDQPVAPFHDDVGIGADERQIARPKAAQRAA